MNRQFQPPQIGDPDLFYALAQMACMQGKLVEAERLWDLAVVAAEHDDEWLKALKLPAISDPILEPLFAVSEAD